MDKQNQKFDYLFPFVIIGDCGVGKSSLMLRFSDDQYSDNYMSTVGVDFKLHHIELDNKTCRLQIWDTTGFEKFRAITQCYYREAKGAIIVYDITNEASFQNVKRWMRELDEHSQNNPSKLLIGNKSDLTSTRVVSPASGQDLADSLGISFLETSAKCSENAERAFVTLCAQVKCRQGTPDFNREDKTVKLSNQQSSTIRKVFCRGLCNC